MRNHRTPALFASHLVLGVFLLLALPASASAATKYWIGPEDGSFANNAHWSTTSGGANDTTAPGTSDIATFDGGDTDNVTIDSNISVAGIDIQPGYTGTITQNATRTITVGSSHWNQEGGTFVGGDANITINGTYTLSGNSVFAATSGTTSFSPPNNSVNLTLFTQTGSSTFAHNGGTVQFTLKENGGAARTYTVSAPASTAFHNLILTQNQFGGNPATLTTVRPAVIQGTYTQIQEALGGTWYAQGDIVIGTSANGGNGTLVVNGTGTQTMSGSSTGTGPRVDVDKPSGSFSVATGVASMSIGNFTWRSGTFTAPSTSFSIGNLYLYGGTFIAPAGTLSLTAPNNSSQTMLSMSGGTTFTHNSGTVQFTIRENGGGAQTYPITFPSSLTLYNVTVNGTQLAGTPSTLSVANGKILIIEGTLNHSRETLAGAWQVRGNLIVQANANGGTASLLLNGTGTQVIEREGGTAPGGWWKIQKPSGQVVLSGALVLNTSGQDLEVGSGSLNLNGQNLTVNDQFTVLGAGTLMLQGGETITGGPDSLAAGSTVVYTGAGTYASLAAGISYSSLTFSGAGTWSLNAGLTVNGALAFSGGTLNANGNAVTVTGLTTLDGGTYQASTAKQTLSGGLLLSGGTFTGSSGPVALSGSLTLASGTLTAPSGTLSLWGDYAKTGGTFVSNGGTVAFTGTRSQTLASGGTDSASDFSTLTISKTSGTLSLASSALSGAAINVAGGTFSPGTLAVTTTALTVSGGTLTRGAGSLATQTLAVSGGTYDANGRTTTVPGLATISGGSYLASTALQALGGLTVSGGTFTGDAGDVDVNGDLVLSSGTLTAPSGAFTVSGDLTKTGGTFATGSGTVTLDGISQTLTGPFGFSALALSGATVTLAGDETVSATLSINAGSTLAIPSHALTALTADIVNHGTITQTGGGRIVHPGSLSVSPASLTVGGLVAMTLTDGDANTDGTSRDTVTVTADGETITLTETADASGIFTGSVPTAHGTETAGNGVIEHDDRCGFPVTPRYRDPQDTSDDQSATATVTDPAVSCEDRGGLGGGGGGGGAGGRRTAPALPPPPAPDPDVPAHSSVSSRSSRVTSSVPSPARGDVPTPTTTFSDIHASDWFFPFVEDLAERGIVSGYDAPGTPTRLFGPADPVTGAQLAKMLLLTLGRDVADAGDGDWAEPYLIAARRDGWLLYHTASSDLHRPFTRSEVARTLLDALRVPPVDASHPFADLPATHPRARAVATAYRLGLLTGDALPDGTPLGTIRPDAPVNRAETSAILARLLLDPPSREEIDALRAEDAPSPEPAVRPAAPPPPPSAKAEGRRYRVAVYGLHVRAWADAAAPVRAYLSRGDEVLLLRQANPSWALVRLADGTEGSVNSVLLEPAAEPMPAP